MRKKLAAQLFKLSIGVLLLCGALEILATAFGLPHIPAIADGFRTQWVKGVLQHDILVSSARWLIGWAIGAVIGILLGLSTGRVKRVAYGLEGLLILCRAIPFISIVPLSLRIFGLSEAGKIFLVAWATAGVCWIIVHHASKDIKPHLLWRAKSLGASASTWLFRVLLPSCHDGIYTAFRTSLSLGLIVIAVAEIGGVYERSSGLWWSEGIGYRLFRSLDEARDDQMLATILTFAALGISFDLIFVGSWWLARKCSFWLRQRRAKKEVATFSADSISETGALESGKPLRANELRAGYDGVNVISGLRFHVPAGKTLSVVGPSGCGKTTLIRAIAHFRDHAFVVDGEVTVGEMRLSEPSTDVGVVLQEAPVFEHMTVWDNITFGNRTRSKAAKRHCLKIVNEFGLARLVTQRAGTLSVGQRQRVALAAALANRPAVLLLDEPFGALDAITRRQLQRFFWQHVHGKVTAVFVTHDIDEAIIIGDRVMIGVGETPGLLETEKNETPLDEWELSGKFAKLRGELITALEQNSQTKGDSQR